MQTELPLIHVISYILWIIKRLLSSYCVYLSVLCTKDALKQAYPAGDVWWIKVNIHFFWKAVQIHAPSHLQGAYTKLEWQCTWNCITKKTRKFVSHVKSEGLLLRCKKDRRDNSSFTSLSLHFFLHFIQ